MPRWTPSPQIAAAPTPVKRQELIPVNYPADHGPSLPPPGTPRQSLSRVAYTTATAPAAEMITGDHGEVVTMPGFPVGVQTTWDGPRRLTFRLPPTPWDTALVVEPPPGHQFDGVV